MNLLVTDCIALCERANGLKAGSFKLGYKARGFSWPRQAAMLLAKENGHGLSHIAFIMGIDHTTVMGGIKAARARRDNEIERQRQLRPQNIAAKLKVVK